MNERRRACWVVMVRVNPKADWCGHGPMTHAEALAFRKRFVGTGIEHQLANLIPYVAAEQRTDKIIGCGQ